MLKKDIKVGSTYLAKISGKVVPVRIESEGTKGWYAVNTITNRRVRILSAAKLRREVPNGTS
jgi:hypothetical protein